MQIRRNIDQQQGFVLATALIFLVVLTLVVLSVANTTSSEEKIARNFRDSDVAFAAAEAALRDAELRITGAYQFPYAASLNPIAFDANCTNGLCDSKIASPAGTPIDQLDFFDSNSAGGIQTNSVKIGYANISPFTTGTPSIQGILVSPTNGCMTAPCINQDQQPRYMIELICNINATAKPGDPCAFAYRITAQAIGRFANTRVVLQELYLPS
jgi:type IV pilus assembly protein PilX